ncbi:restart primosome assembly protein PriB [Thorsellia anophelis DSM 18579]|uniref:Replication restart protein PriB n=1 Tax=Thorsellia anophelis DSM 18579 TaxID=1123402 RepID=A0A1I0EY52_9GAMM|nr:restart primosome assembly protein PriB [Thorsellia anophelis DSM 18579]
MVNRLVLECVVVKPVQNKTSPSGIPHATFLVEHRSFQIEAGLKRQAWCKISVVASGLALQPIAKQLVIGSKINIAGFISQHESKNGLAKLVLHAEKIDFLTHGE